MPNSFSKIQKAISNANKLCRLLEVDDIIPLGQIVEQYYQDVLQHHGDRVATNQLKALYNEACRYAIGQTIKPSTPIWVKRSKVTKLPKVLKPFEPYLSSREEVRIRLSLTMLRSFEHVQLVPVPDLSTVICPSKGAEGFNHFRDDYMTFLNTSRWGRTLKGLYHDESSKVRKFNNGLHYSGKQGIAGATIGNCGKQSLAINEEMKEYLLGIDEIFREEDLRETLEINQDFYKDHDDILNDNTDLVTTRLGRLAFIPDKGAKTRLMAIGNYWIQEVLLGLHNCLYGMLRRLRQDGTYAQQRAADVVCKVTLTKPVWSYDLTAATDRFPVQPQALLLEYLDSRLSNWTKLMDQMEFDYKGFQYTYSVGQPMGLYSSWATFALTHHTIVQYAAWKERKKFPFNSYRILGDDIAIWDYEVAKRYKSLLTTLDVTISDAKSVINDEQCKSGYSAEFAKQIFYNGRELTAVPPNILVMAGYTFWSIPLLFEYLDLHNFHYVGGIPVSRVKSIYRLHDKQYLNLCRAFHIWSIVRHPSNLIEGLTEQIPEFIKHVDQSMLVRTRYNKLMEQAEDSLYELMCAKSELEDDLEEVIGDPVPEQLCFLRIMQTRFDNTWETMERLASNEINVQSNWRIDYYNKYGNPLTLSDLEFIPHLTYDEIKSELTDRTPRKIRLGKYLAELVARVELLSEQESKDEFLEFDDTSLF